MHDVNSRPKSHCSRAVLIALPGEFAEIFECFALKWHRHRNNGKAVPFVAAVSDFSSLKTRNGAAGTRIRVVFRLRQQTTNAKAKM